MNDQNNVIVCGGGTAGVQTAIDHADSGQKVYLVEKSPFIDVQAIEIDTTFPINHILARHIKAASIEILTLSEIKSVSGKVGNFEVTILKKARSIDPTKCTSCGICSKKCAQKAIYAPYFKSIPSIPAIDRTHCRQFTKGRCGTCQKMCPSDAVDYDQQDETITLNVSAILFTSENERILPAVNEQVSIVNTKKCALCMTCIRVCPYGVPATIKKNGKSRVQIDASKCMGCGICTAECPAKAIQLRHFTDDQITTSIDDMMKEFAL